MSSKSIKAPPLFDPETDNYQQFKKDLQIWEILTELEATKKGPAVYLSLKRETREAVLNLSVTEISAEGGLNKIIERLDEVYLADKNTRAYDAFQKFYRCKRESGETFEQFIIRFERLYGDLATYEMTLPEGIRAFFVLNAANLPGEMEKLARATTMNLTYKEMKEQIKKICGSSNSRCENESPAATPVKDEVLYGDDRNRGGRGSGYRDESPAATPVKDEVLYGYGGNRGRGSGYRGRGGRGRSASQYYERNRNTQSNWRSTSSGSQDRKKTEEAKNYTNNYGVQMRCFACDSTQHLIRDCPKKRDAAQEINLVLLNFRPDNKQKTLMMESLGKGVLDCGCTRTVAGEFWMNEYLSTLAPDDANLVEEEESSAMFRFGDGGECNSIKRLIVPIRIGSMSYFLRVEVVANEIPLLLSKSTMKSLGSHESRLDMKNDKWIVDGEEVKLQCTTSGHYCVPVSVFHSEECNITLKVRELDNLDKKDKLAKAIKLHRQFGHASEEKLLRLIRDSKVNDKEFNRCVKEVCENCEICRKFKAPPLKPTVSLPLANQFNQVVCLDLKEYIHNKVWILHMIDAATRYSAARLITSKRREVIATKLFEMWISYFGKPRTLMSDNGGEFANELYTEVSQKLGIEMIMPPAESPFSNGIVERHNKILFETMMKTKEDAKCEPEVALAWACSAKNALQNNGGFSPNQLVFGYNVNIPTVLSDKLPALESTTSSEIIRKNLQALHAARKNYVEAENSDKIRRALRHKTRTYSEENYQSGEKVYFKRRDIKGWMGPGSVMGFDGYTVLIKLGSQVYKCHRCHVMKVNKSCLTSGTTIDSDSENVCSNSARTLRSNSVSFVTSETDSDSSGEELMSEINRTVSNNGVVAAAVNILEDTVDTTDPISDIYNEEETAADDETREADPEGSDLHNDGEIHISDDIGQALIGQDLIDRLESELSELNTNNLNNTSFESDTGTSELNINNYNIVSPTTAREPSTSSSNDTDPTASTVVALDSTYSERSIDNHCQQIHDVTVMCERPKPKSYINVKLNDEWLEVLVLSYQPKKNSAYKDWMNIQVSGEDEPRSINWKHVREWHNAVSPEIPVFLTKTQELEQDVVDAKLKELDNLKQNGVFEEVPFNDQPTISCRWVFHDKFRDDGSKFVKARLVARGFEENSEELNIRTDSPTCNRHSLRLVMMTAATKEWKVKSIDVASAFLQGNQIQRDIYIRPPREACGEESVWKLKRCLYGLNDAPREWYNKVYEEFVKSGAVRSKLDNAMFMWYKDDEIIGHLVSHVDDFNYAGTEEWQEDVISMIKGKFHISSEAESKFMYLGLNVNQDADGITIDQKHYIDKLEEIPLSAERKRLNEEPMTKEERKQLRSMSGQMLWVTSQTRPDAAFGTCMMSNLGKSPSVKQIKEANKAIRKVKNSNQVKIKIPKIGRLQNVEVIVHGDASHASLADGSSQGAFIVFVKGNGKMAPILWRSKKLRRVTKSPLASEVLAIGEASDAGILIANTLMEVYKLKKLPDVKCYTDSKSLKDNLRTSNTVGDMSIRVEMARLREMIENKELEYIWIPGKNNLADVMTKKTASSDALLGVLESGVHL